MESEAKKEKSLKKMLSWSSSSEDEEEEEDELKVIEKDVITHRRQNLKVVDEPQLLSRKVDGNRINPKFLRVTTAMTQQFLARGAISRFHFLIIFHPTFVQNQPIFDVSLSKSQV